MANRKNTKGQTTIYKTLNRKLKIEQHELKTGGELVFSRRVISFYSTIGTRRVTLYTNMVINHKWGKVVLSYLKKLKQSIIADSVLKPAWVSGTNQVVQLICSLIWEAHRALPKCQYAWINRFTISTSEVGIKWTVKLSRKCEIICRKIKLYNSKLRVKMWKIRKICIRYIDTCHNSDAHIFIF